MSERSPASAVIGSAAELDALRSLLRIPTVSGRDEALAEFRDALPRLFPATFAAGASDADGPVQERGVRLAFAGDGGARGGDPIVVLAHYDVVSTDGQPWTVEPFAAEVRDGRIVARGAIDDKGRLVAVLAALERITVRGGRPAGPLIVAFGDDEEIAGRTAAGMAAELSATPVRAVFDEGPGVESMVFRGVDAPVALVGIGERGFASIVLEAEHAGGHASMPPRDYATPRLARAITRVHRRPFRRDARWPIAEMFRRLAAHASGWRKLHYRLLATVPALAVSHLAHLSPEHAALVRTTGAATILAASDAANVLPVTASATIDLRVNPGDTVDAAAARLRGLVRRDGVTVTRGHGEDPAALSDHNGEGFALLERVISARWPGAAVLPTLMSGATDARFYSPFSTQVFRFTPIAWEPGQRRLLHAADEYITVAQFAGMVDFYEALFTAAP